MTKILIVEDDVHINGLLCELLSRNGYTPIAAFSGTEGLLQLASGGVSLILLDLALPGKRGDEVLQEVRATSHIPIIILTAMADKETTVKLLRLGADDYLAKPFDNDELLARIEIQLRRSPLSADILKYKEITLDLDGYDVRMGEKKLDLSRREFEILRLLMQHPQKIFSKNNLYESVWGEEYLGDENTINVHISKLRSKLGAHYIKTIWGIGFKMGE